MNREDLIAAFGNREIARLIGVFESDWLECKREPHLLGDGEAAAYELAKDVSALANSGGGLMLYGFSTAKDEMHGRDRIAASLPFAAARFSEVRLRQVLDNWLVPRAPALRFDVAISDNEILVLVEIAGAGNDWPILVNKIINPVGRASETMLAFCERSGDYTRRTSPLQLQSLLRDGLRFSDELRGQMDALLGAVSRLEQQAAPRFDAWQRYPQCRDIAILAAALQDLPVLALVCIPEQHVDLTELFVARDAPLVRLLEHPPEIREYGFNIRPDINSRIVDGQLRRSVSVDFSVLDMYRDGAVVYAVRGDDRGLCHPEGRHHPQRVNPIFVVETVYLFFRLCWEALQPRGASSCTVRLEFIRMREDSRAPAGDATRVFMGRAFQNAGEVMDTRWTFEEASAERASALLVSELFWRFGLEAAQIPLTRLAEGGVREIDPEAIRNL